MTRSSRGDPPTQSRPAYLLELQLARSRAALLLARQDVRALHRLNTHLNQELRILRQRYFDLLERRSDGEDTETLRLRL